MSCKRQIGIAKVFHLQNHGHITAENDVNTIHLNQLQSCLSMLFLGFPVFFQSSSIYSFKHLFSVFELVPRPFDQC